MVCIFLAHVAMCLHPCNEQLDMELVCNKGGLDLLLATVSGTEVLKRSLCV